MSNMKKILMTVSVAALAVGLTGCGRDNYQGTYTGYEVPTASTTTTGTNGGYNNGAYYNQTPSMVTLTLSNNGDVVSGTYQVSSSYGNYGGYGGYNNYSNQPSTFTANSQNSGQLTGVTLLRNMNGISCFYQGSLSSSNHGQQITGSLTSTVSGYSGAQASSCPTITLNLTRGN